MLQELRAISYTLCQELKFVGLKQLYCHSHDVMHPKIPVLADQAISGARSVNTGKGQCEKVLSKSIDEYKHNKIVFKHE